VIEGQELRMTNAAQLVGEHRSLIAGELHAGGGTFVNVNPATGRIVGHVADATPGEARHAIRAAREAFDDGRWAADAEFRQRCLLQPQSALRAERERLRELIVAESGSPVLLTQGAEWVELGLENDFPCARAPRSIVEASADKHIQSRAIFVEAPDPDGNPFIYIAEAGKVRGQPYRVQRPAPAQGEHTREVLGELGIDEATLDELATDRVI
jgi:crotonobetainyl-CoA:carnitine CoA-transferase CaiB-like acyl-CoA transferase